MLFLQLHGPHAKQSTQRTFEHPRIIKICSTTLHLKCIINSQVLNLQYLQKSKKNLTLW